jgi:hypothetical protein
MTTSANTVGTAPVFTAADELMHEVTADAQFNESMYFNLVDTASGNSILLRMGNRVNEGFAEVTVLVYRPGGAAAFHFERAPIKDNTRFDAAGLRFNVVKPLDEMQVDYAGPVHLLRDGRDLADPKTALASSPEKTLELNLTYINLVAVYGLDARGRPAGAIIGGESTIARGHYQVPCRVRGTMRLEGSTTTFDAIGFRDHSWGPRVWQGPRYWRWISCMCDDRNGFVGWVTRIGDDRPPGNGMVMRDGRLSLVRSATVRSTYTDAPYYPETMSVELHTDEGSYTASGHTLALVPLRNRRAGIVARLAEAVCEYEFEGLTGHGFSEYHDIIEDGLPAGMSEA